jgi:hypothetical protein
VKSKKPARQAIAQKLVSLIETHGWKDDFELAIRHAHDRGVPSINGIRTLDYQQGSPIGNAFP